jgi:hypothetical protein
MEEFNNLRRSIRKHYVEKFVRTFRTEIEATVEVTGYCGRILSLLNGEWHQLAKQQPWTLDPEIESALNSPDRVLYRELLEEIANKLEMNSYDVEQYIYQKSRPVKTEYVSGEYICTYEDGYVERGEYDIRWL